MKIINFEQRTPEWTRWRTEGIGGSDIAAICGVSPFKTSLDVYNDKVNGHQQPMNAAMQRGVDYEEEALKVFMRSQNNPFRNYYQPILCERDDRSYFKASLDGYCKENNSIVEIKVPGLKTLEMARYNQIPLHYEYQIQWQLYVSDTELAYYFVYHPESLTSYTLEIYKSDSFIDKMVDKALSFWKQVVDRNPKLPSKICSPSSINVFKRMIEIKKNEKELDAEYKELLNYLLETEGDDLDIECDLATLSKSERCNIDYKQAAFDARLDLDKYKKKPTKFWSIREKK